MARTTEEIIDRLSELTQPGNRERLLAKGLARGLIWRDGQLPPGVEYFSDDLTTDLLDHGFTVLELSLELRVRDSSHALVKRGLYVAAESLESAVRHGEVADIERGFNLSIAAAAFHIGGYAARAYTLFETDIGQLNLASYERSLLFLMRRNFSGFRENSGAWLQAEAHSDKGVTHRLAEEEFSLDDVVAIALTRVFHEAMAEFEAALLTGEATYFESAQEGIAIGRRESAEANHVPLWWAFTIACHLFDDLWGNLLSNNLPQDGGPQKWPELRSNFLDLLAARPVAEIDLWPSQLEAASRVLDASDDLVAALPTSAGKTRIAEMCILRALADEKRVIYVTPLRALSAQVEVALARTFRPLGYSVTSVYGSSGVASADIDTIVSASIVVATPEKLDFAIRQQASVIDDVGLIVLDEGHMIGLNERDIRYEMLLQRLLRRADSGRRRLVCLSAVFMSGSAFDDFTAWLRSDAPGTAVQSTWRPTRQRPAIIQWLTNVARLELEVEGETPFNPRFIEVQTAIPPRRRLYPAEAQELLVASTSAFLQRNQSVLIYCPRKASVEATAKAFAKLYNGGHFQSALSPGIEIHLEDALRVGREWLGDDHVAVECLRFGIAVHHGSLPRAFLGEIEKLLKRRCLSVCICSPTLAQGVDLSFSVLLFRSLYRHRDELISAKEFANVVGRVGRAYVDIDGIYALPIYETSASKSLKKKTEFRSLIADAQRRQLESGVKLLLDVIIKILTERLHVTPAQLTEYVANMQSEWTVDAVSEDDNYPDVLAACLNELDTAILGIVDALDLPLNELANYLDGCFKSSYWQRRLQHSDDDLGQLQNSLMAGRASWIWSHTDAAKRRGYFAAGVGYAAGKALDENRDALEVLLAATEAALREGRVEDAIPSVVQLAEIIFAIHPFQPEDFGEGWQDVLGHWLRGTALSAFVSNKQVSFIQGDVVFRLVWGVEAARLHIEHQRGQPPDEEEHEPLLALCLTYGLPCKTAALFMQAGLNSRTLACKLAQLEGVVFEDFASLKGWVYSILRGETETPTWESDDDVHAWDQFLQSFEHREHADWKRQVTAFTVDWRNGPPPPGTRVRLQAHPGSETADVLGIRFELLGGVARPQFETPHCFGQVSSDQTQVFVSFFGR